MSVTRSSAIVLAVALGTIRARAEEPISLWPDGAPSALGKTAKDTATLTRHRPSRPNGAAIVLIPGGSYGGIYEGQGDPFAKWLNGQSLTVFVLRYRLGSAGYRYPAQLQDAVKAMRYVRSRAAEWKIDPNRIGVMGFSAGGHLVSTLLTHPEDGEVPNADEQEVSARPDLAILCYPVISMVTKPHATSRRNLIGDSPPPELERRTSSELQVSAGLPPCFVWHTTEDKLVPVEHSLLFAEALRAHRVPFDLHLYEKGDHGTGLMGTSHRWMDDLLFWLRAQRFVE